MPRLIVIVVASFLLALGAAPMDTGAPPAGPPYPEAIEGVRVYDYAEVLNADTIASVEAAIDRIEDRTKAQIVVYTQVKPESDTWEMTERDAAALMDQWGIGRTGIDDGLVILFDLDESRCHGQVQLYAGPGYRAGHLDTNSRQRIFQDSMLPNLRRCDIDTALLAAMDRIDDLSPHTDPVVAIILNRLISWIGSACGSMLPAS